MSKPKPPILFVHGAWLTGRSFEALKARYEARGWTCRNPSWPFDEADPAALRANPPAELATVGITEILDHYEKIARSLEAPPVLVGHSFGGLFVQLLLANRGVGVGAVAVHPAPATGVNPSWTALKAASGVLTTWGHWKKVVPMSLADWSYYFAHQLDEAGQKASYEAFCVGTPGRVYNQALFSPALAKIKVDKADRGPLLVLSGSVDRVVTADMNEANVKLYGGAAGVDYLPMVGRSHYTLGEPGWEAVADQILEWIEAKIP